MRLTPACGDGTGKGSTCALLASALRANGYRVAVYSSPHAFDVRERLSLEASGSRARPGAKAWEALVKLHAPAVLASHAVSPLSHFEVLTALCLTYVARTPPDVLLLEVGLGGVRDATNVIPCSNLEAALVTALDLEHLSALGGDSIAHVAAAKAGIFKYARPAARQCPPPGSQSRVCAQAGPTCHYWPAVLPRRGRGAGVRGGGARLRPLERLLPG